MKYENKRRSHCIRSILPDSYIDRPFRTADWELIRFRENKKGFFAYLRKKWFREPECEGTSGMAGFLEESLPCGATRVSSE